MHWQWATWYIQLSESISHKNGNSGAFVAAGHLRELKNQYVQNSDNVLRDPLAFVFLSLMESLDTSFCSD